MTSNKALTHTTVTWPLALAVYSSLDLTCCLDPSDQWHCSSKLLRVLTLVVKVQSA